MTILLAALPLVLLMIAAYRGVSVIIAAPVLAILAVALYDPGAIPAVFIELFMGKVGEFIRLYFPIFLLGALFGKLIEISGYAAIIAGTVARLVGAERSILAVVMVAACLTYGGVSVYVVVFAVYPFGAALFREAQIPKRLLPASIGLGAFTFTMDALPGTPQIQNIIPTTFYGTSAWAAPVLGLIGGVGILGAGLAFLGARRRRAVRAGEGYGDHGDADTAQGLRSASPGEIIRAALPLIVVGLANLGLTVLIDQSRFAFGPVLLPGLAAPLTLDPERFGALLAVQGGLLAGIATIVTGAGPRIWSKIVEGSRAAVSGALLAVMNTASEFGFGAVIAVLPGFLAVRSALSSISDPLLSVAITTTTLAGITGSASGGMSITLGALAGEFTQMADAAGIPREVLHRVTAMASGGMDTLPHNGAIITLLTVAGLTHREAYRDIFALTLIKTAAVFAVIATFYLTGLV